MKKGDRVSTLSPLRGSEGHIAIGADCVVIGVTGNLIEICEIETGETAKAGAHWITKSYMDRDDIEPRQIEVVKEDAHGHHVTLLTNTVAEMIALLNS